MYIAIEQLGRQLDKSYLWLFHRFKNKKWKSKFRNVTNDITNFNADDITYEYSSNKHVKPKDLDIDIINCWFYLDDNKFKQYD